MRQAIEKAIDMLDSLKAVAPETYSDIRIDNSKSVIISYFPVKEKIKDATLWAIRKFGKVTKEAGGSLLAKNEDVQLRLFDVLKCDKIGVQIIKREKLIYTGEFEDVEIPVYKCVSMLTEE